MVRSSDIFIMFFIRKYYAKFKFPAYLLTKLGNKKRMLNPPQPNYGPKLFAY